MNEYIKQDDLISSYYEDGCCPDCGNEISNDVVAGDSCFNCGHVFSTYQQCDD